jgi:hypothetical protein
MWFNSYWVLNFSPSFSIQETDIAVNKLINFLLTTGEEQITGKSKSKHAKDAILMRQNEINAVMNSIKPGLLSIFSKKFNKEMIRQYLIKIKHKKLDQKAIIDRIMKDCNNVHLESIDLEGCKHHEPFNPR